MKQIIVVIFLFSLIPLTSAQLGYNNPNLPRIDAPATTVTATASEGGNVSSVTSSTNCITVNPTIGDVILTFNTSCGGGGNPFNQVLNTTSNVTFDYITTTGNITSSKWFNGLFNWTTSSFLTFNGAFLDLASTTKQWLYNQTTAVFTMPLLNNTIAHYGNRVGFNSTFNSTYATFSYNQTIIQSASGVSPYINTSINANKGLAIQFNESKLNSTIDNRANKVNGTTLYCSNITGNSLCQTDIPTFNGVITSKGTLGDYLVFALSGIPVGRFTSELARLEIQALANLGFTLSNDDRSASIQISDAAGFLTNGTKGIEFKTNDQIDLSANGTAVVSNRNTFINSNINITGNACLSNGRCLNYTAGLKNSLPIYNKTLLYWNNNTLDWQQLTSPVGDVFLGHCGSTGLSWRSNSASCPI